MKITIHLSRCGQTTKKKLSKISNLSMYSVAYHNATIDVGKKLFQYADSNYTKWVEFADFQREVHIQSHVLTSTHTWSKFGVC